MQFVSKVPLVQTGLCIEEMAEDAAPRLQEEPGSSLVDGGLLASRDSALFKLCLGAIPGEQNQPMTLHLRAKRSSASAHRLHCASRVSDASNLQALSSYGRHFQWDIPTCLVFAKKTDFSVAPCEHIQPFASLIARVT